MKIVVAGGRSKADFFNRIFAGKEARGNGNQR